VNAKTTNLKWHGGEKSKTMKTRLLFLAILFLAAAPLSFARLGETLDQCKTRYGGPTGQYGEDEFLFTRDHTAITVHFRANRSVQEDFGPDAGGTLSEAQVAEILQENSEGSTWEANGDSPVMITYMRKDGRAVAQCAKKGATLTGRGAIVIVKYTSRALAE
jgi:hypothetical protein